MFLVRPDRVTEMRVLIVLSVGIIARHSFQGGGATIRSPPSFSSPAIGISRRASTSRWGLGYDYLAEVWNEYMPDELDEDFGAVLRMRVFRTPETDSGGGFRLYSDHVSSI